MAVTAASPSTLNQLQSLCTCCSSAWSTLSPDLDTWLSHPFMSQVSGQLLREDVLDPSFGFPSSSLTLPITQPCLHRVFTVYYLVHDYSFSLLPTGMQAPRTEDSLTFIVLVPRRMVPRSQQALSKHAQRVPLDISLGHRHSGSQQSFTRWLTPHSLIQ